MQEPAREPLWHVLSRSSKYAVRTVVELADRGGGMMSARELSRSMHVPQRYLSHVLGELARAGILESSRGLRPARSGEFADAGAGDFAI